MSQLEHHVSVVRSREGMTRGLSAFAWGAVGVASAATVAVLLEKFLLWRPGAPDYRWLAGRPLIALAIVGGAAAVAAIAWGIARRPSVRDAAVAIDERLGTKEKFSTALYLQNDRNLIGDPFAQAAVRDALMTADRVTLADRFPVRFPKPLGVAALIGLLAFGLTFVGNVDLFKRAEKAELARVEKQKEEAAQKQLEQVLAQINVAAADVQATPEVTLAKQNLTDVMRAANKDPGVAQRTAAKAQQALNDAEAAKERVKNAQQFAKAKQNQRLLASLGDSKDKTPVAEMARDIKAGEFDKAMESMSKLAQDFSKMDAAEQQKAADQMEAMAKQLQQAMQQNPQLQQLAQQMQQNGVNQQQVQQMQQLMQQAAQGNQQAARQAQQMAQQMMQQAGATPQQQQAVQQLAAQMQGIQNSQALMQQLQQAAQQMGGAMQQQAAQASQQQAAPPQQGQQQSGQQQAGQQQAGQQQQSAQQQAGQQAGQQQSGQQQGGQQQGQKPGQQQGQQAGGQQQGGQQQGQPGQPQGGQQQAGQAGGQQQQGGQQGMQQGAQSMQDALDAMKKDMQQMQAAQRQQSGQQQGNQQNGGQQPNGGNQGGQQGNAQGGGNRGGNNNGGKPQDGNWNPNPGQQQGNPNQAGRGGGGGPGIGKGGSAPMESAPFDFKEEISKSHDDEKGQTLAQTFVKADAEVGEAKAELRDVVRSNLQQSTDEVDSQRISRQAQRAVRDYFTTITGEAPTTPEAPAEQK